MILRMEEQSKLNLKMNGSYEGAALKKEIAERKQGDENLDNKKQDKLVSGENIKTINNETLLGSGNISVASSEEIEKIETSLTDEVKRAKEKENSIADDLSAEVSRAQGVEEKLNTNLTSEVTNRQTADTVLQKQIDAINSRSDVVDVVATKEELDAYSKDITVNDIVKVLCDETQENATAYYRNTADKKPYVWELVGTTGPYTTQAQVKTLVDEETNLRTKADEVLQGNIDTEKSRATKAESDLESKISSEVSRAQGIENTLSESIKSETSRAESAEKVLSDNLSKEVSRATEKENALETKISDEVDRATKKETELGTSISDEVTNRETADSTLQGNIEKETSARQTADKQLQSSIEQEETNRKLADTSLENSINKCKKVFEYLNPTDTTYLIKHDLSTKDFLINVYSIDGADLQPTIYRLDGNNVKLTFNDIPSRFRVVIFSINEWALSKLAFNLGGKEWL